MLSSISISHISWQEKIKRELAPHHWHKSHYFQEKINMGQKARIGITSHKVISFIFRTTLLPSSPSFLPSNGSSWTLPGGHLSLPLGLRQRQGRHDAHPDLVAPRPDHCGGTLWFRGKNPVRQGGSEVTKRMGYPQKIIEHPTFFVWFFKV